MGFLHQNSRRPSTLGVQHFGPYINKKIKLEISNIRSNINASGRDQLLNCDCRNKLDYLYYELHMEDLKQKNPTPVLRVPSCPSRCCSALM